MINHIRAGGEYDLMGGHKTLTIGVTVNLEHYENLRVEVSGDADSPGDAEDLTRFLSAILGTFGRNDPAMAERIDSYRRRVLPGSACCVSAEGEGAAILSPAAESGGGGQPEIEPAESRKVQASAPVSPAGAAGPISGPTCDSCGTPVSPAEQKMSQLFTSRILCRACMKNL